MSPALALPGFPGDYVCREIMARIVLEADAGRLVPRAPSATLALDEAYRLIGRDGYVRPTGLVRS